MYKKGAKLWTWWWADNNDHGVREITLLADVLDYMRWAHTVEYGIRNKKQLYETEAEAKRALINHVLAK